MNTDIAQRLQRLEDRHAISERVITYATTIDAGDWAGFGACFTDRVHVDFSAAACRPRTLPAPTSSPSPARASAASWLASI